MGQKQVSLQRDVLYSEVGQKQVSFTERYVLSREVSFIQRYTTVLAWDRNKCPLQRDVLSREESFIQR
jgi:hypothetical protein